MSHSIYQATGRARLSCVSLATLLANLVGTSALSIVAVPIAFAAAPTCNGLTATIYVDVGDIIVSTVPGDNGDPYTGTLTGTSGIDVIVGTIGADTITGANSNDTICGLDGADIIDTGNGDNWVDAGDGTNQVTGGTGDDTVFSGPGDDTINVSNGTNVVNAGEGTNNITGGTGVDTITTGGGNDIIDASNGNNVIDAGNGDNTVTGGTGDDTITTGTGNDTIDAGNGDNTIAAGEGNNTVTTGTGHDTITTGDGNDVIVAGNGDNNVTAGGGNDSATGGTGTDTFDMGLGNDFCTMGSGTNGATSCEANGNEGLITIVKDTTPDTPGQSFDYTGTVGTFSLAGEASQTFSLSGGIIYTAIETAVPGWTLDSITCTVDTGTSGAVGTATATINLQQGDMITCTFASSQIAVATTTALVSDLNPSVIGDAVTFTATVTGVTPTGTVEFFDGATSLGTDTLDGSFQATVTTSALTVGSHNITATYSGDSGNLTSTSTPALVQVVNQSPTTTALASDLNPSVIGDAVTFTATVTGVTPTGTVEFFDGATSLGTDTLDGSFQATVTTSALTVGSHNITAVYAGDTNNIGSTTSIVVQVVDQSPTSTVTLSANNPSIVGENVDFTATVTGVTPTGTVEFFDGATSLGTDTLDGSYEATFSTSSLTVGTHNITAVYAGDTNNLGSSATILVQVVDQSPTSTVTLSATNPSIVGSNVDFTATVTGFSPTGTVEFYDGATLLGTDTLDGSFQATLSTSSLTVGSHTITAIYLGDTNNTTSSDSALIQVVDQFVSSTVLNSNNNPSVVSDSVTFTATVTGFNPTGVVEFFDGATSLGTDSVDGAGEADFTTSALVVGSHNITAVYAGDTNNVGSSTSILVQVVDQFTSSTVNLSAPNPSIVGSSVTFTATVTGLSPTGTVEFFDGATSLGTDAVDGAGVAELTTSSLTVGSHSITATYSGDTNNTSSSDSALVQVVDQSPTTTVTLSAPNPSTFSQNVDFSVQITGFNPTGTVKFYDGLLEIAGSTVAVVNATSTGAQAFYSTSSLAVGSHDITAVYSGDTNNLETASPTLHVHVVDVAPTSTVVLSSLDPSVFGDDVTFTATVTGVGPTGTITFKNGTGTLATVAVSTVNSTDSEATFTTSALNAGEHSITAEYSGDGNNAPSTSAVLEQDVDQAPTTTTLEIVPNPIDVGDDVTFTATVSGVSPTGTVTFSSDGVAFATVAIDGSGVAEFTSIGSAVGNFEIIATYNGDSNHLTSFAEGQILKVLSGNGLASRFAHLVRYLTDQGSLFGNLAPGSFGGSPIGNGDLTAEQLNVICGLQDSVESLDAKRTVDMLASIYGQLWGIDPDVVRDALRDESLCGGDEAVQEEEAEASTNATAVAGIVPVDSEGVPLSTDPVWNACIRQFELRLPGELKPISCRKYHEDHVWEHPDLLVNIKFYDRHAQKLELPRGYVAVEVSAAR